MVDLKGLMLDDLRNIEVSSEFTTNVNAILENDSDVANLDLKVIM
jgi:hypothetical protein